MSQDLRSIGNILKQEGTSRYERYLPALDPRSVLIDDRKLQDFISYAQRYAKQILYVHPNGENDNLTESWEYFFKNDIVLLLANIATKNVNYYKENYDQLQDLFNQEPSLANFINLLEFTFARFKKINSWYYASALGSTLNFDLKLYIGSYLRRELESLQEMILYARNLTGINYRLLNFKVDFFLAHNQPAENEREINEILQKYGISSRTFTNSALLEKVNEIINQDNVWDLTDRENIRARERLFAGTNDEEKLSSAALRLNKIFDAIYHATENIVNNSQRYFEDTIHQKQDHLPHMALFITFIKLFGYAQQELNKLPQKHLNFYYKDVLRIKTKAAVPDKTFVVLELAKGFEISPVKKGTALLAGKDKYNNELFYETEEDIIVNKAQITAVKTLFIQQNADKQTLNYYTELVATDNSGTEETIAPSWKMFGGPNPQNITEVGFGMASTQFYLAKGERNVVVTFTLEEPIVIEQFNTRLLRLLLTGEKGWLNSDDPKSGININSLTRTSPTTLVLNFSVAITQESAIVAFDPALHPGNFNTALPVAQFILKYPRRQLLPEDPQHALFQDSIYQLHTLQQLKIMGSTIRVQVGSLNAPLSFDGVKDLILENNEAALDSKKPFYPFTAVPKVGSAFYIGCKDLYYKNIDKLSVNLEWLLPDNFRAYYTKYLPPYDSNKFKAAFHILKNKHWQKINDVSVIEKDAVDPKFRAIRLDFNKLKQVAETDPANSETSVDNERQDGTLMLKLNYPDFGHSIYPQLITTAVMEKASSKYGAVDFYKIVKKQLHDSVISIKLPGDINQRQGSLRVVVYDILEKVKNNDQARNMMTNGLSELIRRINGSNIITRKPQAEAEAGETATADQGRVLVNDENYIERILRFLKKVRLIDKEIHYDEDMQNADQVVDKVKEKVNTTADFILPSDQELVGVIMNEANNAINKTVANVVDEILAIRETSRLPDPDTVANLLTQEFNEANEVINDMIARKIAILLSANEIPPPPYAPLVNTISLSYTASKSSAEGDEFFHITPLGVFPIKVAGNNNQVMPEGKMLKTASVFPKSILDNPIRPELMPGMLFMGIQDLVPTQNLSVLVQVAEGSRLNDKKPPMVHWWYLHNYEWRKLNEEALISDSTYGLQTTGILQFSIPATANNLGHLFDTSGLFWLCASVARDPDAFPRLVSLKAQAVRVRFKDQENDPQHLALPLEANKIKNLADKTPQIKKVSQPVSSFQGQVQENDSTYYVRVSERLRHKARAITNWDYERLVLQNFSSVFKVKCLNNYHNGQFVTGHVTIVPVSDLRNKNYYGSNVLIPKTSYIDLRKMEQLLSACSSPFVKVHAVNPQLDQVFIRCKVKFYTGVDQGYYLQRLNEDLIQFLTPWACSNANAMSFSAKIYASSIINFIDQRDYVDYVVDLIMQQYTETESGEKIFAVDRDQLTSLVETKFTTGHSILVSAPKHEIELV